MKRFIEYLWLFAVVFWILLTNEEECRQFEYDNGGGEIEP